MSTQDREAPRVEVALDVFLQTVDGDVPCKTRDASYEGVFIVQQDPLPLRKLIRFRTRIPETGEDLQMLGLVAHTVNATAAAEHERDPGMGIQLFSLGSDTRQKWRDYIDQLYHANPEARRTLEKSRRPSIRVRIPNADIMKRFRTVDAPRGELFVRTPDLHPEDTEVDCVITHFRTGDEFVLPAVVLECVEGNIKERGLRLRLEFPDDLTALEEFVEGEIKAEPQKPAAEESGAEESAPDQAEAADDPSGEPPDEDEAQQDAESADEENSEEKSPDEVEDGESQPEDVDEEEPKAADHEESQ